MNVENLTKLADHLDGVEPEKFDMYRFESECGTVACAAGYLPEVTGIKRQGHENWFGYIKRVTSIGIIEDGTTWRWCFSRDWKTPDNTPQGAAKRIRYLLKNGLPENWTYNHKTVGLYQ